jgi:hypothetical protein
MAALHPCRMLSDGLLVLHNSEVAVETLTSLGDAMCD